MIVLNKELGKLKKVVVRLNLEFEIETGGESDEDRIDSAVMAIEDHLDEIVSLDGSFGENLTSHKTHGCIKTPEMWQYKP